MSHCARLLLTACLCFLFAAACLAGPFVRPPTDEDRQALQKILDQAPDENARTDGLIEMLWGNQVGQARLAVEELEKRDLSEAQLQALENMVRLLPFRVVGSDMQMLRGPSEDVTGSWAWEVLVARRLPGMTADQQIEWLVEKLRYDRPFAWSRSDEAAKRLQGIGATAIPRLIRVLGRDNSNAQLWAARTLRGIGTEPAKVAVEEWALRVLETSDDPLTWSFAAGWLGDLKSQRAYEPLVRMLWAHLDDSRSWTLVDPLKTLDPVRALPELRKVLEKCPLQADMPERNRTHLRVASVLAELGDEAGKQALRQAAVSPIQQVRWEAVFAIWHALGPEAQPLLEKLAQDPDGDVAFRAKFALDEMARESTTRP